MNLTHQIYQIALAGVLGLLAFNAIYLLIFSVAGLFYRDKKTAKPYYNQRPRFLVLLPGYKEDAVIVQAVNSVMSQQYPAAQFNCVVIADSFQPETLQYIRKAGAQVHVFEAGENRSKARAIQSFLNANTTQYDICLVLDADNVIEPDTLMKAATYFTKDVQIVQANRIAKNKNNSMARMDAISEVINNHIFRKGQRVMGFSASLIGSGMFIKMSLFEEVMAGMEVYSGFDKEMELRFLKNRMTIDFASEIPVYDEKVSAYEVFVNQRRRWVFAQGHFLKTNLPVAVKELFKGNGDFFNKVFQFALLPRVITLGLAFAALVLSIPAGLIFTVIASILALAIGIALYLPIQKEFKISDLIKLSFKLPRMVWGMVYAMLTSHRAAGKFIHTPHQIV
jgi:cellulose synthase/poly-beta-1,6-N-acetylglucosamine synthase-like glycosyltransferase